MMSNSKNKRADVFRIDLRSLNGNWTDLTGERAEVYELLCKLGDDLEEEEIMMVRVNDSVIYSSLTAEIAVTVEDLIGFFG